MTGGYNEIEVEVEVEVETEGIRLRRCHLAENRANGQRLLAVSC